MSPPEQTVKVIGDASLLLSTSDGEGFPSVFLEAWAAGTPVVSIQIDPDHKIRNGELGVVAKTVEGAVDAVCSLMTSPQRRQDMGMKCPASCRGSCIVRSQRFVRLSPPLPVYPVCLPPSLNHCPRTNHDHGKF